MTFVAGGTVTVTGVPVTVPAATSCAVADGVALLFDFTTLRRAFFDVHKWLPNGGFSRSIPTASAF